MEQPRWRKHLLELREQYFINNYAAARDFCVPLLKAGEYNEKKSNGMKNIIYDFLMFKGHYGNRINTQGQARVEKVELAHGNTRELVHYTYGQTDKGTPDMDAIIFGRAVKIEIKVGRDSLRKEQREQGERIIAAGGIWYVAENAHDFMAWYYRTFEPHLLRKK